MTTDEATLLLGLERIEKRLHEPVKKFKDLYSWYAVPIYYI